MGKVETRSQALRRTAIRRALLSAAIVLGTIGGAALVARSPREAARSVGSATSASADAGLEALSADSRARVRGALRARPSLESGALAWPLPGGPEAWPVGTETGCGLWFDDPEEAGRLAREAQGSPDAPPRVLLAAR